MRTILFDLLKRISMESPPEPIVEFGAARATTQTHLPSVRSIFPGFRFTGADMNPGMGVDQLQDLRDLGLRRGSVGTALLLDTIEHVEHPTRAVSELHSSLAPHGVLLMTTHFFFPIHRFPQDFWRLTSDGMLALLQPFAKRHAGEAGLQLFPHTVVGLAGGSDVPAEDWDRFVKAVDNWLRLGATSWKERSLNILPPILSQRAYQRYARTERKGRNFPTVDPSN